MENGSDDLLERERELAVLRTAITSGGRLVLVEGTAGIGKSSLLGWLIDQARHQGLEVLTARGTELESNIAFGVATQLYRAPLQRLEAGKLRRVLSGAAAPAAPVLGFERTPPAAALDEGQAVLRGLYWLTEALCEGMDAVHPLVLVVDDAQWADVSSLRLIHHLAVRLPGMPLTIVLAARLAEDGDQQLLLEEIANQPGALRLRPHPLSEVGIRSLLQPDFAERSSQLASACAEATGGNPFMVRELVKALRQDAVPAEAAGTVLADLAPEAVVRSVLIQLSRLSSSAQALARSVATLGDEAPLQLAAELAGITEEQAEAAADALGRAELFRPGEPLAFRHPLIAAAVRADLGPVAAGRDHRRAAALLQGRGAGDDVVAAHLLVAPARNEPWAADVLRRAGRVALERGEHHAAVRCLDRALEEQPGDTELLVELGLAEAAAAEKGAVERLLAAVEVTPDPRRRAEALLALAQLLVGRGDFGGAAEASTEGLACLAPDDPLASPLRTMALTTSSRHRPSRRYALAQFEPLVKAAARGEYPDDPAMCARLASRMASARQDPDRVRELVRRSLDGHPLVDASSHGIPFAFAAAALFWIEEFDWCLEAADRALEVGREIGSPLAQIAGSHVRAMVNYQLGRLDVAAADGERAMEISTEGWDVLLAWLGAVLTHVEIERGDLSAARAALEVALQTDQESLDYGFVLLARAALELADDRPAAALELARGAGQHLEAGFTIDNPALAPWRSLGALAASRAGDPDLALQLAEDEVALSRGLALPCTLARSLRRAAIVGPAERRLTLLEEALSLTETSPARLERARTLLSAGTALRQFGRLREARPLLRQAAELADACGARPLAETAEEELHVAGGRRRAARTTSGLGALTPTERRVAELAGEGLTNLQIAQRLYLTTKTVETHLSAVYRKLAIPGRRQLGTVLARE